MSIVQQTGSIAGFALTMLNEVNNAQVTMVRVLNYISTIHMDFELSISLLFYK